MHTVHVCIPHMYCTFLPVRVVEKIQLHRRKRFIAHSKEQGPSYTCVSFYDLNYSGENKILSYVYTWHRTRHFRVDFLFFDVFFEHDQKMFHFFFLEPRLSSPAKEARNYSIHTTEQKPKLATSTHVNNFWVNIILMLYLQNLYLLWSFILFIIWVPGYQEKNVDASLKYIILHGLVLYVLHVLYFTGIYNILYLRFGTYSFIMYLLGSTTCVPSTCLEIDLILWIYARYIIKNVYTCVYTWHTYIHTYIHTWHTYIHTYITCEASCTCT